MSAESTEKLVIRRMLLQDLDEVLRVEHRAFTAPVLLFS